MFKLQKLFFKALSDIFKKKIKNLIKRLKTWKTDFHLDFHFEDLNLNQMVHNCGQVGNHQVLQI